MMDPLAGCWKSNSWDKIDEWHYRSSFFDGKVGLAPMPGHCMESEHQHAEIADIGLDKASSLLADILPQRYREFTEIVAVVHPVVHEQIPTQSLSSNSGNSMLSPPGVFLTVTDPVATAEAMVHEMAHHKLFSIGVSIQDSSGYLANDKQMAYSAAVDIERPLPAVLHAAYSFLHMIEFDLQCINDNKYSEEANILLKGNQRVATSTVEQLKKHAIPTSGGRSLFENLFRWHESLLKLGNEI